MLAVEESRFLLLQLYSEKVVISHAISTLRISESLSTLKNIHYYILSLPLNFAVFYILNYQLCLSFSQSTYITTSSYHCCQQSVAEHDGVVIEEDGHGLICQRQGCLELLHNPSEIVGGDEDNNKETEDQRLVKEHHLKGKRILCAFSPF